jgi:pimeloyl-ACP methyl ester carboxylesterase
MRRFMLSAALCQATLLALAGCGGDDLASPADGGAEPAAGCSDGTLPSGALSRFCFPSNWNGELVVYAHGYVSARDPIAVRDDPIGNRTVSEIVNGLGYAFATTSYRANGLVVPQAVEDLVELRNAFDRAYHPDPARTYVVGVSEGGLIAALAAERHPELLSGALAACGPVGDFQAQLDYFGDFRVVFDYLFPGVLPGSVTDVPADVRTNWASVYVPAVVAALRSDPVSAAELLHVTGAPFDPTDITTVGSTTLGILWYDVFALPDARERLGGQPYDNTARVYAGSRDDVALNAGVTRVAADPAASAAIRAGFETTGQLGVPVVTLHTTGDPIVPFAQEPAFAARVQAAGAAAQLTQIEVARYGHCTFQESEVLGAFSTLVERVTGRPLASAIVPSPGAPGRSRSFGLMGLPTSERKAAAAGLMR